MTGNIRKVCILHLHLFVTQRAQTGAFNKIYNLSVVQIMFIILNLINSTEIILKNIKLILFECYYFVN
jgi:hypothetical protein